MKSWFPIKTKETTLSRNTHLVLLLFTQWAHTSSFYDTVGLYPLIYLHSGHHPHHLLYTDCPASFPLLLAQWAHISSFYHTVGLYPLIYLHSGHHPRHVLYTDCPASVPPLLAQWAHTSSFYDRVGLHLLFLTQWAPPSKSAVHTLSSLISLCPLCKKMGGIGPLCQKMRRYGTTVQVREKMKLDSLCTVDGFGGAPCISKWGYRPTVA